MDKWKVLYKHGTYVTVAARLPAKNKNFEAEWLWKSASFCTEWFFHSNRPRWCDFGTYSLEWETIPPVGTDPPGEVGPLVGPEPCPNSVGCGRIFLQLLSWATGFQLSSPSEVLNWWLLLFPASFMPTKSSALCRSSCTHFTSVLPPPGRTQAISESPLQPWEAVEELFLKHPHRAQAPPTEDSCCYSVGSTSHSSLRNGYKLSVQLNIG